MTFSRWLRTSNSAAELREAFDLADKMTGEPRAATHLALIALANKTFKEIKDA